MYTLDEFNSLLTEEAGRMHEDTDLQQQAFDTLIRADRYHWIHQTTWQGRPALQLPQDLFAMQEIIYKTRPMRIVELGVAWGGTSLFLLDMMKTVMGTMIDRCVIGVDKYFNDDLHELRKRQHSLFYLKGDTIDMFPQVKSYVNNHDCMIIFDSNHTHDHVLKELELYHTLLRQGNYMVICDTIVDELTYHEHDPREREWGPGNSPRSALNEFLNNHPNYKRDKDLQHKLLMSCQPDGYVYKK